MTVGTQAHKNLLRMGKGFEFRGLSGLWLAVSFLIIELGIMIVLSPRGFSFYDFHSLSSTGASLALVAIGATVVIITGGFDLSAGTVVALINVILASQMTESFSSQLFWCGLAILIGAGIGMINGFLVAYLRLQSIVVTLAMMFVLSGVTMLIMEAPGGAIPPGFCSWLTGQAIPGILPMPVLIVLLGLLGWRLIRSSPLGTALYAIGSDEDAARANCIRVRLVKLKAYVIAGVYYAVSGIFLSGLTGAGDPRIGLPMLLPMFAAVVLGGTQLGGGKGGATGSVFGAYILTLIGSLLLLLDISAYYSTAVEGCLLIFAALGTALSRDSELARSIRFAGMRISVWLDRAESPQKMEPDQAIWVIGDDPDHQAAEPVPYRNARWAVRNGELLRMAIPPYFLLLVVGVISYWNSETSFFFYFNSLLVLTTFLAILGLGQGAVILTGGLDLSIPWNIAFCGILLTSITHGDNTAAVWAIPLVLLTGTLIGLINGIIIAVVGLSPIVSTLAMNGILQGAALVYSDGSPQGWAPSSLRWLMTGKLWGGVTPIVCGFVVFVIAATLLLSRTTFGRRVYAVGNSTLVATLSGISVRNVLMNVYMLSGACAAIVGILLTGFNGQAFNGMGDTYLLPGIAVVVVGGTLITGGKGHYIGIFGGALLLTALNTLLAGSQLPLPVRDILYGVVVLIAVFAHRERQH